MLCGSTAGRRTPSGWVCAICNWRYGDSPDPDLPQPHPEVVYYLRWQDRIKIGTSRTPRTRVRAIRHEELLAFERGGREVEHRRHLEFAGIRVGGEWFRAEPPLLKHIARISAGAADPWHAYARWVSAALRGEGAEW